MSENPSGMATMLDLPRELYLLVTSDLSTKELVQLSAVSRDHYLAAQQPLFDHVRLNSYGALVKLVSTLLKPPIVSHISPKQRQNWYKLSDAELRERDIRTLDLTLDSEKDRHRMTGVVLSRFISVISRKCDTVKISLTLLGLSEKLAKELDNFTLPNVTELTMFLGRESGASAGRAGLGLSPRHPRTVVLEAAYRKSLWSLAFGGTAFPDLRTFYMNDLVDRPDNLPPNMERGFYMAAKARPRRRPGGIDEEEDQSNVTLHGLARMQTIKLEYNTLLNSTVLKSLFGSTIIPKHLTRLEIVNCPSLHPIVNLEPLATLLLRALQLVQFLKLHLTPHFDGFEGYGWAYLSKINQHPEHHLCHIIRDLGQKIKGLDLAVPFVCGQMFVQPPKGQPRIDHSTLSLPEIPETPVNTLPQRLTEQGYRYRRVIFNGFCRDTHGWDEMTHLAGNQKGDVSWELLYNGLDEPRAMWFVSGCLPVEFSVKGAMEYPFEEGE